MLHAGRVWAFYYIRLGPVARRPILGLPGLPRQLHAGPMLHAGRGWAFYYIRYILHMLANCGLDQGRKVDRVWENYYILQNSWFGSIVVWISMKVAEDLMKLLHPPEFMVWISCGLDEHVKHLSCFLEWGASPPNPPGFVALARHYAFRQAELAQSG